jgi:hypothetical protein
MELPASLPHPSVFQRFLVVADFLEEPEMVEYKNRKNTSLLPSWVREYQKLEEGPISISEQQTSLLYDKIAHLEEKLNTQAMDFEASYFALEKEMATLQSKYNEKKKNKRGDGSQGKRKRTERDENLAIGGSNERNVAQDCPKGSGSRNRNNMDTGGRADALNGQRSSGLDIHENLERATATAASTEYLQPEVYSPYYHQERIQHGGTWHGTNSRRYY